MNGTIFTPDGQNDVVEFVHLGVNSLEHVVRIGAFAHQHDSGNHVFVVDDLSVLAANGASELTQPYLGTLRHGGNVADVQRRSILRLDHGVGDVAHVGHHAHFAHIHLLQPGLDEAAAGVGVIVRQLLFHLADAEPVSDQLVRIDAHLILARRAAEAGHVHHVRART